MTQASVQDDTFIIMEENLQLVSHPSQRGRHPSTTRLLWWLAADLVIVIGFLVWYLIGNGAFSARADSYTPSGYINASLRSQ